MEYASVEEGVGSLFQSDALLSAQYFETLRRKVHLEPEKRLVFAVLEDAVACFQTYVLSRDDRGKALFREAEQWIMEESNDWIFSFENICDFLEIDPDYLRRGLRAWKESHLRRAGPRCVPDKNQFGSRQRI